MQVPHLLGLQLDDLSHAQLDAMDELHQAILRAITHHRIRLVADREKMLLEEGAHVLAHFWSGLS